MALITTLETDNGWAKVKQDGADYSWSAYLYETQEDLEANNYYRIGRGHADPVSACDWANKVLRKL